MKADGTISGQVGGKLGDARLSRSVGVPTETGAAVLPPNEEERLAILRHCSILDTEQEAAFNNTGPGIAPEDLSTLFQRYRQTDTGRTKRGTGIGLFIVKSLVEAHGGTVRVESTLGTGTRFTVSFPLTHESPQRT